jgi:hypothetical protein
MYCELVTPVDRRRPSRASEYLFRRFEKDVGVDEATASNAGSMEDEDVSK